MAQTQALAFIAKLPRSAKIIILIGLDAVLLPLALYLAYVLRLGQWLPSMLPPWWLWPLTALSAIPLMYAQGVYDAVVRYLRSPTLILIVQSLGVSTLLLVALVFLFSSNREVPRSVLPLYLVLSTLLVCASRLAARGMLVPARRARRLARPVAIYGAGIAGRQLASALEHHHDLSPRLFFDDSRELQGRVVQGLRVHAPAELDALIERHGLTDVLLAIPSLPRSRQREIFNFLDSRPVKVMVMPSMTDVARGQVTVSDLREVQIEDILGREPVVPDSTLLHLCITGKAVMVTGAGGSIGAELSRQIVKLTPSKLVLFEQSELALYEVERELRQRLPDGSALVSVLGNVQEQGAVEAALRAHAVQTVYHAAAYKHVPLVEHNPFEGVLNNTFGTLAAAQAARAAGTETFVLISTDKAVRPTNVMGASKRLAEMALQAMAQAGPAPPGPTTVFSMVRFGNVLGSSGSVVPLFREQIHRGGPVTITHPDMVRYFMTIPEAAQLVIQAGAMGRAGEVFVLDMGEPVKILDLARRMIRLSGLTLRDTEHPDGDIGISFTGVRPGEKLFEELLIAATDVPTRHPRILCAQEAFWPWERLAPYLEKLRQAISDQDAARLRALLGEAVSGYLNPLETN
ncbi:MAG: polysaccharide biosynthesis protein [Nevskiales bacterium]